MKMMEIMKLWVRCIAASSQMVKSPGALRQMIILARAAQEYYTSGLYTQDTIDEIRNAHSHPYIYDGTPSPTRGLEQIIARYNIRQPYVRTPGILAYALKEDIQHNIITPNGDIDYANNLQWPTSMVLQTHVPTEQGYINAQTGLPLVFGKMLAKAQQK